MEHLPVGWAGAIEAQGEKVRLDLIYLEHKVKKEIELI